MNEYNEAAFIAEFGSKRVTDVWVNKPLIAIQASPPLPTEANHLQPTQRGSIVLSSGKTCSGEWIDAVVFENWLIEAIKRNVFSLFVSSNKVTTEQIIAAVKQVVDVGVSLGGITNRYRIWAEDTVGRKASIRFRVQRTNAIQSAVIDGTLNQ